LKEGVMMMKEELINNRSFILISFLIGGVMGAGAALLLAPKPGKEIREDIKRFAVNTKDRAALAVDKTKEVYDESKAAVINVIEAGKNAYVRGKEKWQHAA
jgi:gas vesicle protein